MITVIQHFIFGDEIVAFDHQMRFNNEIQFTQEVFDLLRTFDFDGSGWMAQLNLHARMIRPASGGLQESVQRLAPDAESVRAEI